MKKIILKAQKRVVTGRKVKTLRKNNQVPGTVYGKKIQSVSVTVESSLFDAIYKDAGETGLIELTIDSEVRPVLIHNVQKDPVTGAILHAEFFQVDLKEKVRTKVPIEITGEAEAVSQKVGTLLPITDEVEVEALPTDLPEKISVDVTSLATLDQEIKIADIKAPSGVTILTEAGQTVVKVVSLVTKEAEQQAAAEEAAKAAAAAQTEGIKSETAAQSSEEPKAEQPKAEKAESQKDTPKEENPPKK